MWIGSQAGPTAPAEGLYLREVEYPAAFLLPRAGEWSAARDPL